MNPPFLRGSGAVARDVALVFALAWCWWAATAWLRPLMLPDEGRYATVAWEMLRSGDWLTPTLNGLPFFHKPPLFYWITATAQSVLGLTELAARAASITGAALAATSLYLFTRHWAGGALARRSVALLAVQPLFFVGGQFANLDMLVAGCITATVLALAHAALRFEAGASYRRMLVLAYGLSALGVLAKGLIGFVIPAMVIGAWLLLRWRWRSLWALCSVPGMLVFAVVAVPWFALMQLRHEGFLHYFFAVQHFQRFAVGGFNNAQPAWFYPAVLSVLSLPALLWALRPVAWRRQPSAAPGGSPALRGLMATGVVGVLLFFSMPPSKLLGYILPAVPALACLIASASLAEAQTASQVRWWRATLVASLLPGLALVVGLTIDQRHSTRSLGQALGARHQAGEAVYMLHGYRYDVPFYARLRQPMRIVEQWDDPELTRRDNWRKEVADAGAFRPQEAARLLLLPSALAPALCADRVSWVVGATRLRDRYPFLAEAQAVHTVVGETLWRVDTRSAPLASALGCSGTPNGG